MLVPDREAMLASLEAAPPDRLAVSRAGSVAEAVSLARAERARLETAPETAPTPRNRSLFSTPRTGGARTRERCLVRFTADFSSGPRADYADALRAAVFAPAPGGTNEESFRVWEALDAGAIPVVRAGPTWEGLGAHPLPTVERWEDLADLLLSFRTDTAEGRTRVAALQAEVAAWWRATEARFQALFERRVRPWVPSRAREGAP
jgi:hypothetical protein